MNRVFYVGMFIFSLINFFVNAQDIEIQQLGDAPASRLKMDDFWFVSHTTGWLVDAGYLYKTTNGGQNWDLQYHSQGLLRCLAFQDSLHGFVGKLDSTLIIYTTNGGNNWLPISYSSSENKPLGICGISIPENNSIYACGKFSEPAYFIKSTDRGKSWMIKDMKEYASSLIDCYFFNNNVGILVGGKNEIGDYTKGKSIVLYTSNGGENWETVYTSSRINELCWKIYFLNENTGYISIQSFDTLGRVTYLKTKNKGITWEEKYFDIDSQIYEALSIYFVNENIGIIGGMNRYNLTEGPTYYTIDGGLIWSKVTNGVNINRFRQLITKFMVREELSMKL